MRCLARAGDQSGNLLWRIISGGEWPTQHMPKTVAILIGTNDLSYADCNDDEQEITDAAPGIISRWVLWWMVSTGMLPNLAPTHHASPCHCAVQHAEHAKLPWRQQIRVACREGARRSMLQSGQHGGCCALCGGMSMHAQPAACGMLWFGAQTCSENVACAARAQGDADRGVYPRSVAQDAGGAARHPAARGTVLDLGPGLHLAQPLPEGHRRRQCRLLRADAAPLSHAYAVSPHCHKLDPCSAVHRARTPAQCVINGLKSPPV